MFGRPYSMGRDGSRGLSVGEGSRHPGRFARKALQRGGRRRPPSPRLDVEPMEQRVLLTVWASVYGLLQAYVLGEDLVYDDNTLDVPGVNQAVGTIDVSASSGGFTATGAI